MPNPCLHHWVLGDLIPGQPRDQGTCRLCGAVKDFPTEYIELPYTAWDRSALPAGERDIVNYMAEQRRRREV